MAIFNTKIRSPEELELLALSIVGALVDRYRETRDTDLVINELRNHVKLAGGPSERERFLPQLASALLYELTATLDELDE